MAIFFLQTKLDGVGTMFGARFQLQDCLRSYQYMTKVGTLFVSRERYTSV